MPCTSVPCSRESICNSALCLVFRSQSTAHERHKYQGEPSLKRPFQLLRNFGRSVYLLLRSSFRRTTNCLLSAQARELHIQFFVNTLRRTPWTVCGRNIGARARNHRRPRATSQNTTATFAMKIVVQNLQVKMMFEPAEASTARARLMDCCQHFPGDLDTR